MAYSSLSQKYAEAMGFKKCTVLILLNLLAAIKSQSTKISNSNLNFRNIKML